jgi:predicted RecA/RadA family phage recombinase
MDADRSSRMIVLAERLRSIDKSMSRLTAERLKVLAEIAKLDAEDGASERQTASRVARLTSSTPKQAADDVAMAKQVAALPGVANAHANGEISNSQLGAVAAIASASSEQEALELAKTGTSSQLYRRAAASRGKLFEERRKAHTGRYLAFKPEEDGQSTRIHGRLPFAESKHLEEQLRKIADRLGLCDKERPSPSARMADALLILTKNNPSQALHDHEGKQAQQAAAGHAKTTARTTTKREAQHDGCDRTTSTEPQSEQSAATNRAESKTEPSSTAMNETPPSPTARPRLYALSSLPGHGPKPAIDYDEDPFPEIDNHYSDNGGVDGDEPEAIEVLFNSSSESGSASGLQDSSIATMSNQVVVHRADTRVIIHWNAQSGEVQYENGPPIDHPRLLALLCDAQIDIQHCDPNGLPTGLITTAHHSSWQQDRYLAFRDGVCRIPECEGIGKTQAHHIFEDRNDRVTSVEYMINLCNRCHQQHHDGTFSIAGDPEQTVTFTYKDGTTLKSSARPLPNRPRRPKPIPLSKYNQELGDPDLFAKSA